jgi:hypothetical protein
MNFFTSLFSLAASENTDINDEVNIPEAITAHVNWKVRLQKYVDGKSEEKLDPMVICRDDQCTLGQWIHGPATKRFHADKAFHTLRADHAQFHYVAANVVRYMQEGDKAGAQALLKGEYARVSHNVMMMLNELNQQEEK